jgi:hypothetical protein
MIPVMESMQVREFLVAAQDVLPVTIYLALLVGLGYSAKRSIPVHISIVCLIALCMGCTILVSGGISLLSNSQNLVGSGKIVTLGNPGLILSQPDGVIVLLHDPGDPQSSRVIVRADQPLIYREKPLETETDLMKVPAYMQGASPAFLQTDEYHLLDSLLRDFSFVSDQFNIRQQKSFFSFIFYVFALIFLLSSLRPLMDISVWRMANIFLGIMMFRGVLLLERLLDSQEIYRFFGTFLGERFPRFLISPLLFCMLGILVIMGTVLFYAVIGRGKYETD